MKAGVLCRKAHIFARSNLAAWDDMGKSRNRSWDIDQVPVPGSAYFSGLGLTAAGDRQAQAAGRQAQSGHRLILPSRRWRAPRLL